MQDPAPPPTFLTRFASYARVSTAAQAEKELSIPAQQRECRAHVTRHRDAAGRAGGVLVAEFADPGLSGTTMERPGLQDALAAARRGEYDVLLVHKLDRLSRESLDTLVIKADLAKHGVQLASVTESFVGNQEPMQEVMETIAMSFNKLYVANLRAESRKGLRQAANPTGGPPVPVEHDAPGQGRMNGPAPYGYRFARPGVRGGGWDVDEAQAAWVRHIYAEFGGGKLAADICRELNGLGVPPPGQCAGYASPGRHGSRGRYSTGWHTGTVREILASRVYRGHVCYAGEWYAGQHPAIVDAATWTHAQDVRRHRAPGRAESAGALFSGGLLRCPLCLEVGHDSPLHVLNFGGGRYGYRCGRTARRRAKRREGNPAVLADASDGAGGDGGRECAGYQISERKVAALLREYLTAMAALLENGGQECSLPPIGYNGPAARAQLKNPCSRPPCSRTGRGQDPRDALEQSLIAEWEGLPRIRQNFQRLAARDLMTEEELADNLRELDARAEAIRDALSRLEAQASVPPVLGPADARHCLHLLDDLATPPLQKRDRIRQVFAFLVPGTDKCTLSAYLNAPP
ncbi:MAG: recombinase family protein [Armatimonadetes bacterium]|nr:recombinase family protein [Armatimonadota bacterium]